MAKVKCQSKANPTRLKPPIKRIMQSNLHVHRIGTAAVAALPCRYWQHSREKPSKLSFSHFCDTPSGCIARARGRSELWRFNGGWTSQDEGAARRRKSLRQPVEKKKKKLKKTKQKASVAQEWSHAMLGRACTAVCRQGWTCTARCLLLPLKGEVQPWIIRRFHFKTNVIFSKHDCVFFRPSKSRLCLVCLFHGLTGDWCRQPTWLLWYRPAFRNDTCLLFHIAV